jgi:hypothetical protein
VRGRRHRRVAWNPALSALVMVGAAAVAGAARTAVPHPESERVIIRLADRGGARAGLMMAVLGAPFTLDARHERVVEGLRAIHAQSLADASQALSAAEGAGALRTIDRLWIVNAVVAEVDPAWIERLDADPSIAEIVPDRRIALDASAAEADATRPSGIVAARDPAARASADPVPELVRLRVPEVWAQGITGQGVIVANVDTGVNGEDDTFGDRWRGRLAGSDATWFAPVMLTVFPEDDFSIGSGHGSATMGILTGGEESYGVAFDATWIAGDAFENGEGYVSNVLKIYEWMTDPDGDPATRLDVPDVINNSFGIREFDDEGNLICDSIFDDAIDALEAAGAIVIWSAGNEGANGVTSPGSRADSPVNAFSVGSVDANDQPAADTGLGPSACGGPFATKPEVVAPGVDIMTRTLFNQFTTVSGTSFSTPMVGGVLALMRSKNPTITPEAAKAILLETARDLGTPGDDNTFGNGLVDANAAVGRVDRPAQPLARLVGFRQPELLAGKVAPAGVEDAFVLRPGGSHALIPVLTNHGPAIPGTTAVLSSSTAGVTVTQASLALEPAGTGAFFGPGEGSSFGVDVDASVAPGARIVLDLAIQGAPVGPFRMVLLAGDPIAGTFATHDRGQVRLTVTNFGGLGYYTGLHESTFVLRGNGFRFPPGSPNWLFHGGFMAGVAADRLSDEIPYGEDTQNATDWFPLPGFPIGIGEAAGGQRIVSLYDDRHAIRPLGLRIRQESFAFGEPDEDSFVVLQYILTNTNSQTLGGVRVGLFTDWDLPGTTGEPRETAGWDPSRRLGFVEGSQAGQPALGVVWLDDAPLAQITYAALTRADIVAGAAGNPAEVGPIPAEAPDLFTGEFSDVEKWEALTSGQSRTSLTASQDVYQVIGVGPLTLAGGATDTVAVALVAASDRATLQAAAETARETYFTRILGTEPPPPPPPPAAVVLEQNFPNPFRAGEATTISYALPPAVNGGGEVDALLAVYDVLGRRVRTLVDGPVIPGEGAATWDGRDETGALVPSGVYIVRLATAGSERTVRVLVVR